MWETYRMLGHEREQELLREARRLHALGPVRVRFAVIVVLAVLALAALWAVSANASTFGSSLVPLALNGRRKEHLMGTSTKLSRPVLLITSMLAALIVATPAFAKPDIGGSTATAPDLVDRWVAVHPTPDVIERWLAVHPVSLRPDDRSGLRTAPASAPAQLAPSAANDAFQWGDAAVGAGMSVAILLLAGSSFVLARRATRRRRLLSGTT